LKKNKTQNMREIIADSGVSKEEMPVSQDIPHLFKNDYDIIKTT
tara:strand:- start:1039 stop:1170 length:132 start_codon:yes stop_codon:yes gene_type:complete